MTEKRYVTIDPDFWQKTITRDYADWPFAWAREAAQNSCDAGAKNIDIEIEDFPEEEKCLISWTDDGCGMTGDIMLNCLMAMGGSDKDKKDSNPISDKKGKAGGYGVAKAILFFAQNHYTVESKGGTIRGRASEFTYDESSIRPRGTRLVVEIPRSAAQMRAQIAKWAKWSSIQARIRVNGQLIPTLDDVGDAKAKLGDWATIYVKDGGGGIKVRINGQFMYQTWGPEDLEKTILVDIEGSSLDYFTSNRDRLRHEHESELRAFIGKLYQDPTKIVELEDVEAEVHPGAKGELLIGKRYRGDVSAFTDVRDAVELARAVAESNSIKSLRKRSEKVVIDLGFDITPHLPALNAVAENDEMFDGLVNALAMAFNASPDNIKRAHAIATGAENASYDDDYLPDRYTLVVENRLNRTYPQRFRPGKMDKHATKLMERWIALILVVADIIGLGEMDIMPGWVFSMSARALYVERGGRTFILLNPTNPDGSNYWKLSGDNFYDLLCIAIHELTHAQGHHWHDEMFANALGVNMAKCMAEMTRLRKVMRS